jgi:hypothetical protein
VRGHRPLCICILASLRVSPAACLLILPVILNASWFGYLMIVCDDICVVFCRSCRRRISAGDGLPEPGARFGRHIYCLRCALRACSSVKRGLSLVMRHLRLFWVLGDVAIVILFCVCCIGAAALNFRPRKILSDVDDTLFSSGGSFPAGIDKVTRLLTIAIVAEFAARVGPADVSDLMRGCDMTVQFSRLPAVISRRCLLVAVAFIDVVAEFCAAVDLVVLLFRSRTRTTCSTRVCSLSTKSWISVSACS